MSLRIINNTKYIKHVGEVSLNIGANVIDEKQWDDVKDHPIVKDWIENEDIEVETGDMKDITVITPASKAIKLIETTFDKEILESWLDAETRKTVKEAIKKQIEYLAEEKKAGTDQ